MGGGIEGLLALATPFNPTLYVKAWQFTVMLRAARARNLSDWNLRFMVGRYDTRVTDDVAIELDRFLLTPAGDRMRAFIGQQLSEVTP
ncbi:hypothetical protein C7S18_12315 [Ahniella affigens]|uniref:Uncharacterized protein n=2 Tax=Ahniella affigens TaxID=2021234 RepID=A0A2P1PSX1_9GAMM|nr:hypothetical protein C7S18_12315 [Ahniella affigens]